MKLALSLPQRMIAVAAAALISGVLWLHFEEDSLSDVPWLAGVLAVAGLLMIAVNNPSQSSRSSAARASKRPTLGAAPKASIVQMFTSARNLGGTFFKNKTGIRVGSKPGGPVNEAFSQFAFAYLAPKFVLSLKIEGFKKTAAAAELSSFARRSFQDLAELEERVSREATSAVGVTYGLSVAEVAVQDAQDHLKRLNRVFDDCYQRFVESAKYPLDPLFVELDRVLKLAAATPGAREKLYKPLFDEYFGIWGNCDLSEIDIRPVYEHQLPEPVARPSSDLEQALGGLLDHLSTAKARVPTVLEPLVSLKREVIREILSRDEKRGFASLFDRQASKDDLSLERARIQKRVSQLKAELDVAPASRIERLFERLCRSRPDLEDAELSIRRGSHEFDDVPPLARPSDQ